MKINLQKKPLIIKSVITALTAMFVSILISTVRTIAGGFPSFWFAFLHDGVGPAFLALVFGAVVGVIGNLHARGSNRETLWFAVTLFIGVLIGFISWPLYLLLYFIFFFRAH